MTIIRYAACALVARACGQRSRAAQLAAQARELASKCFDEFSGMILPLPLPLPVPLPLPPSPSLSLPYASQWTACLHFWCLALTGLETRG